MTALGRIGKRRRSALGDPIGEAQVDRAWRRVASRRAARRRRGAWRRWTAAGLPGGLALALVAFWGVTFWGVVGGERAPADVGPLRLSGDSVVALPEVLRGPATVHSSDGSTLVLDSGTVLRVAANTGRRVVLALRRGRVRFDVPPNGPRTWSVDAGTLRVDVLGTRFSMDRTEPSNVRVAVTRGEVAVLGDAVPGGYTRLGPGDTWPPGGLERDRELRRGPPLARAHGDEPTGEEPGGSLAVAAGPSAAASNDAGPTPSGMPAGDSSRESRDGRLAAAETPDVPARAAVVSESPTEDPTDAEASPDELAVDDRGAGDPGGDGAGRRSRDRTPVAQGAAVGRVHLDGPWLFGGEAGVRWGPVLFGVVGMAGRRRDQDDRVRFSIAAGSIRWETPWHIELDRLSVSPWLRGELGLTTFRGVSGAPSTADAGARRIYASAAAELIGHWETDGPVSPELAVTLGWATGLSAQRHSPDQPAPPATLGSTRGLYLQLALGLRFHGAGHHPTRRRQHD